MKQSYTGVILGLLVMCPLAHAINMIEDPLLPDMRFESHHAPRVHVPVLVSPEASLTHYPIFHMAFKQTHIVREIQGVILPSKVIRPIHPRNLQ